MARTRLLTIILFLCFYVISRGQTDSTRNKIIEGITHDFLWEYVSYDKAKEMTDFIHQKFVSGGYDTTLNIDEFTYELTKDLRSISKDEHIIVMASHYKKYRTYKSKITNSKHNHYRYTRNGELKPKLGYQIVRSIKNANWKRKRNKYYRRTGKDKFSYGQIKILPGNIGYFEIYDFNSTAYRRNQNKDRIKLKSVMQFLKNTNSIIIDLRANTGGYIFLSNYFTSFFIDKPNTYFITTEVRWVKDTIPNGRDTIIQKDFITPKQNNFKFAKGKNIYVLTSSATFSAAELTSYALKKLSNIEIVGEQTRGGGNGHFGGYGTRYYAAIVPSVKVFDKENNYTIESKGITPDTLVVADSALKVAYLKAFKKAKQDTLKAKTKYFKGRDETKIVYKQSYIQYLPEYIGDYRKIKIALENNKLVFTYDKWPKEILIPRYRDNFKAEHFKNIKFIRNNENKVTTIQVKWLDGFVETYRLL